MSRGKIVQINNIDLNGFSNLIKKRMNEKNISRTQFSSDLVWAQSMASMILSGKRFPSSEKFEQILSYLEISIDEVPTVNIIEIESKSTIKGNKIFISYSHRDKEYLDRLMVHIKPLERNGLVDAWVDTRLQAGDRWEKEIEQALGQAKIAVLLISADFLASDFIIKNELPPLLHAAEENGTSIIPIILKPCRFIREKNLCEFHSINSPDEPLSLINENERELTYDTVAQRIEQILEPPA
jgi:transcriptional regulator with XRE-family HTH domain